MDPFNEMLQRKGTKDTVVIHKASVFPGNQEPLLLFTYIPFEILKVIHVVQTATQEPHGIEDSFLPYHHRHQGPQVGHLLSVDGLMVSSSMHRNYLVSHYPVWKEANPQLPILIREANGVPARIFGRFGRIMV